jgi:hypothetical protein
VDENGNATEVKAPRFEPKPHGGCVIVGEIDPESMESVLDADIYADWDAAGYLGKVLEILQPERALNVPDLREIFKRALREGDTDYICEYCERCDCRDCIVRQWKEDQDEEPAG